MEAQPGEQPKLNPANNPSICDNERPSNGRKSSHRRQADLDPVLLVGVELLQIEMPDQPGKRKDCEHYQIESSQTFGTCFEPRLRTPNLLGVTFSDMYTDPDLDS
jgi:hypothetical protein